MRLFTPTLAIYSLLPSVVAVKPFPRLKANENFRARADAYLGRQVPVRRAFTETSDLRHPSRLFTTLARAKVTCRIHESICGVFGHGNTQQYQCVDTSTALDNCGGCITPHLLYEPYRATSEGVQCSKLPGVIAASCRDSQCVVSRCRMGFEPNADRTKCVPMVPAGGLLVNTVLPILRLTGSIRHDATTELPPTSTPTSVVGVTTSDTSIKEKVSKLANAVLHLENATSSSLGDLSSNSSGPFPLNSAPIDSIVQATIDLVASVNASAAVTAISNLATASTVFAITLNGISAPAPELTNLLLLLDSVGQASLDLKNTPNLEKTLTSVLPFGLSLILTDLVGVLTVPSSPLHLENKIAELVKLVLALQVQTATLLTLQPSVPAVSSPNLPGGQNLLSLVVRAMAQMVGSVGLEDMSKNVEVVVDASTTLESALRGCGCAGALGLGEVLKGVGELRGQAVEVKELMEANANMQVSDEVPVVTNANVLVQVLGEKLEGNLLPH